MYVITGATGNTGRVAVNELLRKGQPVRAVARDAARLEALAAKGAETLIADLTDAAGLTRAFAGARAVYLMIPPGMTVPDYHAYQARIAEAVSKAVAAARVTHAVLLSSVGADKPAGTGPVAGLHRFEQQLSRIDGLNVLSLRAAYFMENTLEMLGAIQAMGKAAGPLRPDLRIPMIATRDIGAAAAEALLGLDFEGQTTRELLGQRDISMEEAVAIIGRAIGKPGLEYVQLPDEQVRAALTQMGVSADVARLLLEMAGAINRGQMQPLEPRSARNTTPTSYETFVAEEFVPRYRRRSAAG
jgi:uncharacterized protein YbjT (DUF2867 family)